MDHSLSARLARGRWRDLRLWLGVALIVTSMVIGSRLVSHADDRITVWRATHDLSVGAVPIDLEPVAVGLGEATSGYARASVPLSGVLLRPVAAGELIPASAVGEARNQALRIVTLPIEPLHAPVDLAPGDRVDVWATPTEGSQPGATALVQPAALVSRVSADTVGVGGEIGVSVEIPEDRADALIAAVRGGEIDLVAVPIQAQA